ncbi:MAG: hypothetical protein ED559_11450 [Phycisphaera sp.]|nr:MAG: hypothetical protein ED559_11450 [Phycisphaera sp.]
MLNIAGDLVPEIDAVLDELLERGKKEKVMILAGTERPEDRGRTPYAQTKVEITFDDEEKLRTCVRLLRWSDDRLRARPDQLLHWDWNSSFREGMTIKFGVSWYTREFFESRKDAFKDESHSSYFAHFGANADDMVVKTEIVGATGKGQ